MVSLSERIRASLSECPTVTVLGPGVGDQHHAGAGREPIGDLLLHFGEPVARGDDLYGEVRRAGPVTFDLADGLDALAPHEGRVGCADGVGIA